MADWGKIIDIALKVAPTAGKALTGGAKGSKEARESKDALLQREASDYERALQNRRELELRQKAADADARQAGFKGALRSAAIQQWQPAQRTSGMPTFSFVRRPDTAALPEYERQMMMRLLEGEKFDRLPPIQRWQPSQSSTWEKLAGILGLGLGVTGALTDKDEDEADTIDTLSRGR